MPPGDDADAPAFDPSLLIDVAADFLFDGAPSLTQSQIAEAAGVSLEEAKALWRYLGFPDVPHDRLAFTPGDVEALKITKRLTEMGVVDAERIPQFVRSVGRSFSRLADWQTRLLLSSLSGDDEDGPPLEVLSEVIPMVEQVQNLIWRRHLLATASRIALSNSTSTESTTTVIGFVDIVGYTSRTRQLSARALGEMVEWFERVVTELVVTHGGQVVKTIGDEVLFQLEDPIEAGFLALELVERSDADDRFPKVRVGAARGPVLARLGDVFGPTVNIASRLTSVARPGRVLVDDELAAVLRDVDQQFRVRRIRSKSVKGYDHLEPWSVRRPRS